MNNVNNKRLPELLATMQFSTDQRVFIVTTYLQTGSLHQVQDQFEHFPKRTSPSKPTNYSEDCYSKYRTDTVVLFTRAYKLHLLAYAQFLFR